jgi:hypothetical protein
VTTGKKLALDPDLAAAAAQARQSRRARAHKLEDWERSGALTDFAVDAIALAAGSTGQRRLSALEFERLMEDLQRCLKQYTNLPARPERRAPRAWQDEHAEALPAWQDSATKRGRNNDA